MLSDEALHELLNFNGSFSNALKSKIITLLNPADKFYLSVITRFIGSDKG
jgi:hypothetical protein